MTQRSSRHWGWSPVAHFSAAPGRQHQSPSWHARHHIWHCLSVTLLASAAWSSAQELPPTCQAPECVDASSLHRVKIVPASYPPSARINSLSGFVELVFTVQPDGSIANIEVIATEPPGVFEASAVAALTQWRYEPVLRDGKPVAQRAVVRIRFAL